MPLRIETYLFVCSDGVSDQLGGLLSDFEAGRAYWDFEGVPGPTGKRNHSVRSPSVYKGNVKDWINTRIEHCSWLVVTRIYIQTMAFLWTEVFDIPFKFVICV